MHSYSHRPSQHFKINILFFFLIYFIYLFLAALGLCCYARAFSSCSELGATLHCGVRASHWGGFSGCRARALGAQASVVVARGLSSCGSRGLERSLSSCGTQAYLLRGMWDLLRPGIEPVSPALAGRFLTTAPPGKSLSLAFLFHLLKELRQNVTSNLKMLLAKILIELC